MHQPNRSRVGRTPELEGIPEADRNRAANIQAGGSPAADRNSGFPAAEPRRDSEFDLPVHRRRDRPSGFGSGSSSQAPDSSGRRSFPATCTALSADSGWNQNRQRETLWSIRFRSAAGRWGGFTTPDRFRLPNTCPSLDRCRWSPSTASFRWVPRFPSTTHPPSRRSRTATRTAVEPAAVIQTSPPTRKVPDSCSS